MTHHKPQTHSCEQYLKYTHEQLNPIMGRFKSQFNLYQITGSKGKSSTAYFLSQLLQNSGLFISPHIFNLRERFQINSKPPSDKQFAEAMQPYVQKSYLSPFQKFFLSAFNYFSGYQFDNLVVEVGIGGYYDDTSVLNKFNNLIKDKKLIITQIEKEHSNLLGNTLYEIAVQKTLLTDKVVKNIIIHPNNLSNAEIKDGIYDCLTDLGISPSVIQTIQPQGDVFNDCLQMALTAVGQNQQSKKHQLIAYNQQIQDSNQIKMLPAHQTQINDMQNNNMYLIDGAHTTNSIKYTLKNYKQVIQQQNRSLYPTLVIFSQTKTSRDYQNFIQLIQSEVGNVQFCVATPPATFDLAINQDLTSKSESSLNKEIYQYLKQQSQSTVQTENYTQLRQFVKQLKNKNVLVLGSLHSAAAVLNCLEELGIINNTQTTTK